MGKDKDGNEVDTDQGNTGADTTGAKSELTHEEVEGSKAFQGVKGELMETREENRRLQERLMNQAAPAQQEEESNEVDYQGQIDKIYEEAEGSLINAEQLRRITELQDAKHTEQTRKATEASDKAHAQEINTLRDTTSQTSLDNELKLEYGGKIPQGLDRVSVFRESGPWLRNHEPGFLSAALKSDNPARKVYDLCTKFVPAIIARKVAAAAASRGNTVEQQGEIPGSGGPQVTQAQQEENETWATLMDTPEDELIAAESARIQTLDDRDEHKMRTLEEQGYA